MIVLFELKVKCFVSLKKLLQNTATLVSCVNGENLTD